MTKAGVSEQKCPLAETELAAASLCDSGPFEGHNESCYEPKDPELVNLHAVSHLAIFRFFLTERFQSFKV